MAALIKRFVSSVRTEGLAETIYKIFRYPLREDWIGVQKRISSLDSMEDRFTEIYRSPTYWGGRKTISGHSSTLKYTENLRSKLPQMFEKFNIKSLLDAPCGDFNWMKEVLKRNELKYIGCDIVAPLIDSLNSKYRNEKTTFIHLDITKGKFPAADLMICRDCLFHLSFSDTRKVLENFAESQIPYLLTTTDIHTEKFDNLDIETGGYRPIDLFSSPYNLPKDVLFRIPDWREPYRQREMCLWSRGQVLMSL